MLTRKPRKGDRICWPDSKQPNTYTVVRTPEGDDNLCWIQDDRGIENPFIWRFREGLNTLAVILER